ncbi:MAG TPA: RtcB family protein, partial [bacterium]|nr:RtcB family protein [bacterium]
ADPALVSKEARKRGRDQLGTLGAGNHFLEIQVVDEVYDAKAAEALGLQKGQVTVMIHCGSRGLGHQACTDSINLMRRSRNKFKFDLPDAELVCAPVSSDEGQEYLKTMNAAANFALANRQCIMHWVRETFEQIFGRGWQKLGMTLVYDVSHNIAKIEQHRVGSVEKELCVHRKGATRCFPAGHPSVVPCYRSLGQPVIVPGNMGDASYVLLGQPEALLKSFGSTCHGAGREMSRNQAIKAGRGRSIEHELGEKGIQVRAHSRETLSEEMPEAYKNIDQVVSVVEGAGLSSKVVRLKPVGVIKG